MCIDLKPGFSSCFVDDFLSDSASFKAKVRQAGIDRASENKPHSGALFMQVVADYPIPAYWDNHMRKDAASGKLPYTGKSDIISRVDSVAEALQGVFFHDKRQIVRYSVRKQYGDIMDSYPCLYIVVAPLRLWERFVCNKNP